MRCSTTKDTTYRPPQHHGVPCILRVALELGKAIEGELISLLCAALVGL